VYVPVNVVAVARVNTTVSPVSSVTVIDAPTAISSLIVAVMLMVVPIPYVPSAFVEENDVTTGRVVSGVPVGVTVTVFVFEESPLSFTAFKYIVVSTPLVSPGIVSGLVALAGFNGMYVTPPSMEYL
jgi:hypothetical protein